MNAHVVEVADWQNSMTVGFQQLLQNSDLCDVTLEGNDGTDIRCHSVVLAAASPYFRNTLVWTREDFHIKIGSISSSTWKCIVEFIYCGRIIFDSQNAVEIVMIVKKLGLSSLHNAIQQYFRKFGITDELSRKAPKDIERETVHSFPSRISTPSLNQQISPGAPAMPQISLGIQINPDNYDGDAPPMSVPSLIPITNGIDSNGPQIYEPPPQLEPVQSTSTIPPLAPLIHDQPDVQDQLSFCQVLGLQAHKPESDLSPEDTVRKSKRLSSTSDRNKVPEVDGQRSSGSPASSLEAKAKDIPNGLESASEMREPDPDLEGKEGVIGPKFTCKFCFRVFANRSLLCKHKAKWHAKPKAAKLFWCKICNVSFKAPSALFKHKKTVHTDQETETAPNNIVQEEKPVEENMAVDTKEDIPGEQYDLPLEFPDTFLYKHFTCKVCEEIYPDRHSLYEHKMEEHYVKKKDATVSKKRGVKRASVKKSRKKKNVPPGKIKGAFFRCKKCFKSFTNPGALRWHKCAGVNSQLPEGVTKIIPETNDQTEGTGEDLITDPAPENDMTGITEIGQGADVKAENLDQPLDLSTKLSPGAGFRCDDCQKVFNSLVLVRWHKMRCTSKKILPDAQINQVEGVAKTPPTCHVCQKTFKTPGYLQWHMNRRHGIRIKDALTLNGSFSPESNGSKALAASLECNICYKTYANRYFLNEHIQAVHEKSDAHKCHYCQKSFSRRYYLAHHIKKVHEGFKPLRCEVCKKAFITMTRLVKHMKFYHNVQTGFKCPYCEVDFSTKKSLETHLKQSHNVGNEKKEYQCPHCTRLFARPHHLARHVKASHGNPLIFSCQACKQKFSQERYLLDHLATFHKDVSPDMVQTQTLPVNVPAMPSLIPHNLLPNHTLAAPQPVSPRTQSPPPPPKTPPPANDYICGICRNNFPTEQELRNHVKNIHESPESDETGGSPSSGTNRVIVVHCDECGKGLTSRNSLSQHIRTVHQGIRKHECNICQKKFTQKHHLTRHVFLHGGLRPFECRYCQKRFITKYNAVVHEKSVHRDEELPL